MFDGCQSLNLCKGKLTPVFYTWDTSCNVNDSHMDGGSMMCLKEICSRTSK
jgi:hypothetical protein